MKSGIFFLCLVLVSLTSYICTSWAQDQAVEQPAYVPPPLFGAPREPPPRSKIKTDKMPAISKKVEDVGNDVSDGELLIAPRFIKQVPEGEKKPNTPKKIEPKPKKIVTPPKAPTPTPIPSSKEQSNGIVKGPKTMPAVKKQGVDAESTFVGEGKNEPLMPFVKPAPVLNKTKELKNVPSIPPHPKETLEPKSEAETEKQVQSRKEIRLGFAAEQSTINREHKDSVQQIVAYMNKHNKTLVTIEAYASPQPKTMNGDRRLALSRAMSVREFIVANDIDPSRISVRSLGSKSNINPLDRVEIKITD